MARWKHISDRVDISQLRWFERKLLEHADPLNLFLHIIAGILLIYGLWINVMAYVVIAIIIALLGHIYVWSLNRKIRVKKKK